MEWHIFKADKKRKKISIRGTLWNGDLVKLPGHRDRKIAERMRDNIASLNRSKFLGELPDPRLNDWIANLPQAEAERYVSFGLLPRRLLDRGLPINVLIDGFALHVEAGCEDQSRWAKMWPQSVRRLFAEIGKDISWDKVDEDQVNIALKKMKALSGSRKGQPISQKTKREYIFAIKAFGNWMVKKRGALSNPFNDLQAPSAKGDPVRNRRPMRIAEFSKLAEYLRNAPSKYAKQQLDWSPVDRLMIYWTAVMTGFRASELRSLNRASVNFDTNPILFTVEGWAAKNRLKATVPVKNVEFIKELKEYTLHLLPGEPLLPMPAQGTVTRNLYRDMDAAGVQRQFGGGNVIDFHTLRSTAMYWWLTRDYLDLVQVQERTRLNTLSLVQEYIKNHVPEYADLMASAEKRRAENLRTDECP